MSPVKSLGKFILYSVFFICAYLVCILFFGLLGSLYYDGKDEAIGKIYSFTMLVFPPLLSAVGTFLLAKKLKPHNNNVCNEGINSAPDSIDSYINSTRSAPPIEPIIPPRMSPQFESPEIPQALSERRGLEYELLIVDSMEGHAFEYWCADALRNSGFSNVSVTPGSGDQGVDVLAVKDGIKYAVQCKCYSSNLGNTPIQEVSAGKSFYHCHVGAVMTNRYFTPKAKELAEATGTLLWDRDWITAYIRSRLDTDDLNLTNHTTRVAAASPIIHDEMLPAAVDVILETNQASVSMVQRHLKLGYARAARIFDEMEELGIVGPFRGSTPREILITKTQWLTIKSRLQ